MIEISKTLLDRCAADERRAQEELYKLLYTPMMRVCRRYYINSEDSLSAMHNGFLRIIDNIGKFRYDKSFMAWSRTVMVNTIIDELRQKKRRAMFTERYAGSDEGNVHKSIIVNEVERIIESDYINTLLSTLPDATRIVFNLFVFEDYSHKEISIALGIAEGTSKWHVAMAKSAIARILEKKKDSEPMRRKEKIKS